MDRREAAARLHQLLEQEPERTQTILELRLEGYSYQEIAARCGLSESSARVIAFRARNRLRTLLVEEGFFHE